ncbi:hypothetical protein [Kitasatospora sp. HPMI-4]|uniref:hypothetical protein n=1 Tax=Kitasatospora sp. HPMI-4 TaxID=3448443 RepID=UPI003F1C8794
MTPPNRRPLGPGPSPAAPSAAPPTPARAIWPLLPAEEPPTDSPEQAEPDQAEPDDVAAPTGRRPLWDGPRS